MTDHPGSNMYQPLPNNTSIRLLRILSEPGEDPLCSLETFDIDDEIVYDCLSYTWGDPLDHQLSSPSSTPLADLPPGQAVTLDCGYKIDVTPNLFDALQHLCSNGYSTMAIDTNSGRTKNYLWIDALCIDQSSTDEKNIQVSMMGRIYEKAQTVIIWLGPGDEHLAGAAKVICRLSSFSPKQARRRFQDIDDPELLETVGISQQQWVDYAAFLQRRWFGRIWVVQESFFSGDKEVWCGDRILPWSKLMTAAQLLDETHLDTVLKAYILNMLEKPKFKGSIRTKLFDNRLNNQQIFGKLSKMSAKSLNLGQLLYFSRCFNSTDPRDHIFAVLGMWDASQICRGTSFQIKPDYDSPVADIYVHATYMAIYEARDLGMLGLVEDSTFRDDPELPSWVPDYRKGHRMLPLTNQVRSGTRSNRWKASDGLIWNRPSTSMWSRTLPVEGLLVDVVDDIGPTYAEIDGEFLLKDLLSLVARYPYARYPSQCVSPSEAFWRTIIQDTFREQPADNDAARNAFVAAAVGKMRDLEAEIAAVGEAMGGGAFAPYRVEMEQFMLLREQTLRILARLETEAPFDGVIDALTKAQRQSESTRDREDFEESFRIAYYGRRMFRTRKGYFGITAQSLHQGDCVWVLAGADTPFVLSRLQDENWRVVGEAYVFGIMNGEVLAGERRLEKVFLR
ncbi:HET-domain-containing protein [Coniochaeta ligniaria NRRL 30616]|uniref:HET-domain-containing protein n=1 Tax=Coniochaeta ligniaria NRRL 30616 TaxID=1408157 RepID=A0A1J7IXA8_9PEZI|nr:HET-domain-containing protein [Coniochaeta ligniaria NRRL 30616]